MLAMCDVTDSRPLCESQALCQCCTLPDFDAVSADGPAAAASDFVCTLTCAFGPGALANETSGARPAPPPASIFSPPYAISNANQQLNISAKTLPVTARHADGTLEYDAHNLYGYMESVATARALRAIRGKRHFSFSRCVRNRANSQKAWLPKHQTCLLHSKTPVWWALPGATPAKARAASFCGCCSCKGIHVAWQ